MCMHAHAYSYRIDYKLREKRNFHCTFFSLVIQYSQKGNSSDPINILLNEKIQRHFIESVKKNVVNSCVHILIWEPVFSKIFVNIK